MHMKYYIFYILLLLMLAAGCRKSDYILEGNQETFSDNGGGTGTVTWTSDKDYILEGLVFVNDGQVLTIEPGTVIRFKPGQAENASALVVARGGKIIAEGTANAPIIFTAEADDLNGSVAKEERGMWGGLIILGNAPINLEVGEASIEGIPFAEPRGIYGGIDEEDNSGVLKYVSIRHGGTNIGDGNEINGLTLGGVGSKTEIDYVEIISNEDDGVEVFGGTVNLKHMVVSGCGDDAFDYDLGWNGNGQFWLGIQSNYYGDNLIEAGGGVSPVNGMPYSLPHIFNTTLIGNGNTSEGAALTYRNNAGGTLANSVIINKSQGVLLEVTDAQNDSYFQWQNGNVNVQHNVFYEVASSTPESVLRLTGIYNSSQESEWENSFYSSGNEIADPKIDYETGNYVPESKIQGDLYEYPESWFQIVNFKGAFGESNWIEGWTLLNEN